MGGLSEQEKGWAPQPLPLKALSGPLLWVRGYVLTTGATRGERAPAGALVCLIKQTWPDLYHKPDTF